jgi:hypothetical protein
VLLTAATIASKELVVIRRVVTKGAPNSKRQAGAFEPTRGTNEVPIDPDSDGKVLCIGADLSPK